MTLRAFVHTPNLARLLMGSLDVAREPPLYWLLDLKHFDLETQVFLSVTDQMSSETRTRAAIANEGTKGRRDEGTEKQEWQVSRHTFGPILKPGWPSAP